MLKDRYDLLSDLKYRNLKHVLMRSRWREACPNCAIGPVQCYTLVPVLSTRADRVSLDSHVRWEFPPISEHTLVLFVSGRMYPKLTSMSPTSTGGFPGKT